MPLYLIGYLISIAGTGIPTWSYLIPIKLVAVCLMLVGGNGVYYIAEEKQFMLAAFFRTLKNILISFVLLFIFAIIQNVLKQYSVDLTPFIGM
ncbi:hypothetical protein AZ66_28810 [Paenibacillus sp. E194]|uniref:hypothetical protein n=1 Tax=Paenibacillus sp. E194 TaxID=1458845 RepID=UPI0005CB0D22|nr:hypothetical protein [Paenibacillus sp. E194]KJB84778.1 hypothetical protein AZ66_28810 [Paenibacillus sp. E194]